MKKNIQVFSRLFISMTLIFSSFGSAGAQEVPPESALTPLEIQATHKIFRKYIENVDVGTAYRNMQLQLLNLSSDSHLTNFLINGHPILDSLFRELRVEHEQELQDFSMMARTSMVQVTPGYDAQYDRLLKMIKKSASKKGFSQKAIDQLELYLMAGDLNAFTVSGSDDRIIVVVQSKLIKDLTGQEVQAVIDHELGHILSFHSLKNQLYSYMMNMLALTLAKNGLNEPNYAAQVNQSVELTDYQNINNRSLIAQNPKASEVINVIRKKANAAQKRSISRSQALFQKTLTSIQNLPPEDKTNLLASFILYTLQAMIDMNASHESIMYFNDLYQNIYNLGSLRISLEQLAEHAEEALNAVSRTDESSADQYASAGNPNEYIASAFGKLLELVFTKENRANVFKNLQIQAEKFESEYSAAERSPYMGTSHPALVLRINNILKMDAYPAVLFANSYLKLLVLESAIRQSLGQQTELAEVYTSHYNDIQNSLSHDEQDESLLKLTVKKSKIYEQNMKLSTIKAQELAAQHTALVQDIVASIVRLKLSAKINPRLSNTIEHFSYLRETELNTIIALQEQLKNPELSAEEQTMTLSHITQLMAELNQPEAVLVALAEALQKEITSTPKSYKAMLARLKSRLAVIQTLMTTKDTAALEQARTDFVPKREAGTVADRRRIPKQTEVSKEASAASSKADACRKLISKKPIK